MGDLIGESVHGTLSWIPERELVRVLGLAGSPQDATALFADACRLNALYMIARAGSGHIGSSFSCLDVVAWLLRHELRSGDGASAPRDRYFSSKGHDAPALYAILTATGVLPFEKLHQLRRLSGLPGHPDVGTPGIVTNTGSLGMGISKAKGLIRAQRLRGESGRVYVLTGDGELQEGQNWEALIGAANERFHELTVIVDHNKLQSDGFVSRTSDLGDLVAKFEAFGARVARVDGHDLHAVARALDGFRGERAAPQVLIADTIKGRGVSFMEHTSLDSDVATYRFHSGAPDADAYARAVEELGARLDQRCDALGVPRLELERAERPAVTPAGRVDRCIQAYAEALVAAGERHPELVVLDADLCVDTGQGPFKERFAGRFVECGIAEMDLVSQAGGLALAGMLPVCHSFACFLGTRANEHIYNNATERTRIVYVASLAGLLPAGPGHSHQSVRDVSALGAVPGLVMIEPSSEVMTRAAVSWLTDETRSSVYLRLCSVPVELPFVPSAEPLRLGVGHELRPGADAVLLGYGPVMLREAWLAAERLELTHGLELAVVDLPWLNVVDRAWLARAIEGHRQVFTLDDHYVRGGQGELIAAEIAQIGFERPPRVSCFGVDRIPECGTSSEVLRAHQLDAESLANRIAAALRG
jgi:transketolase